MKTFLSIAIVPLLVSCASVPAHAEEPLPPKVAAMANAKTERVSIDRKLLEAIQQYLATSSIESLRTCQANPQFWFCNADKIRAALQKDAKPILEAKE